MPESRIEHHMLTKVGEGGSAEVYAYGNDRVIKLFRKQVSQQVVQAEWRHARLALSRGIPGPGVVGMVRVGDRIGLTFERCEGPTVLDAVVKSPDEVETVATLFFALQCRIHSCNASGLPPTKDRLERKIRSARGVGAAAKQHALAALDSLPDGTALCHGDFHPRNVVLTAAGPKVLDWLDAGAGDAAMDVARTLLLIEHASQGAVDGTVRQTFRDSYLRHWQREWPDAFERIEQWRYPLAVARLAEAAADAERLILSRYVERIASERV